jgi:uncharacterized protein YjdB
MKVRDVCGPVLAAMVLAASCGIESYLYLPPVSSVTASFNSSAIVRLPESSDILTIDFTVGKIPSMTVSGQAKTLGSDYEIYYRIYLSDKSHPTVNTSEIRRDVNPTLEADWAAFEPYTVDSNNRSSAVASLVTSRKYYSILMNSSGNLMRANGNGAFNPKPTDRLFMTSDDLFDSANLTDNVNADIAGMATGTPMYAYVSMYIVMRDFDTQTLSPVYSAPTFINVFLLPSNIPVVSVTGVNITAPTPQGASPAAIRLTANVTPANATNKGVEWTVNDTTNAGIRVLDAGNAVIVYSKTSSGGTITVTARTNDGNFTANNTVTLSGIAVQTLALNFSQQTLSVGASVTLTATVTPTDAKTQAIAWSSSNTSVATVDSQTGFVTGKAAGTATITATTTDGTEITKTCEITVN